MGTTDLKSEIQLCTKYLSMDSRNFHCWNYRRYVMRIGKVALLDELKFSSSKIDDNFSNYSAWHHRSYIIPQLIEAGDPADIQKLVDEEFELLKQAFYTDPGDQSTWLYHRWLLGQVIGLGVDQDRKASSTEPRKVLVKDKEGQIKILQRELAMVEELIEIEPDCKWALLTVAMLIGGIKSRGKSDEGFQEKLKGTFEELIKLDPFRQQYYLDMKKYVSEQGET
eukprot:995385-Amorphochlora_amoeboformis.AAC.1